MTLIDLEETREALSLWAYVGIGSVIVGNLLGVVLVALQLPGTWLILLLTGLLAWSHWETGLVGWTPLLILSGLAVAGEILEFVAGSVGAKKAGGSKLGAVGALLGSIPGAIAGSIFLPIPIVGTIVGACVGAAAGSLLADRTVGLDWTPALKASGGAAAGTLVGTLAKIAIALVMWVVSVAAIFL